MLGDAFLDEDAGGFLIRRGNYVFRPINPITRAKLSPSEVTTPFPDISSWVGRPFNFSQMGDAAHSEFFGGPWSSVSDHGYEVRWVAV